MRGVYTQTESSRVAPDLWAKSDIYDWFVVMAEDDDSYDDEYDELIDVSIPDKAGIYIQQSTL